MEIREVTIDTRTLKNRLISDVYPDNYMYYSCAKEIYDDFISRVGEKIFKALLLEKGVSYYNESGILEDDELADPIKHFKKDDIYLLLPSDFQKVIVEV